MGFVVGEQVKIGYNHWDSYPEGLGFDVFKAVQGWQLGTGGEIEHRVRQAQALVVVDDKVPPTPEQQAALMTWADTSVGNQSLTDWYCLLRNTQGDLNAILDSGHIVDAGDFPLDSLFCEWGYLVDFDARRLEVYEGFQEQPPEAGRWRGQRDPEGNPNYHAVNLAAWFDLGSLAGMTVDEFVTKVRAASSATG